MKRILIFIATTFIIIVLSRGNLCAENVKGMIYVSDKTDTFAAEDIVREFVYGETAYCAFFARDYALNKRAEAMLTIDITLKDPAGTILFEEETYAKNRPLREREDTIVIFDQSFDITFTEDDPLGMYTLEAKIHDYIAGSEDIVTQTILLFDTERSRTIIMREVDTAATLDMLWEEYFRSGNPWAIKRIISALQLQDDAKTVQQRAVGSAAQWSLEANAKEHAEVLAICEQTLPYTQHARRKILQEIIDSASKEKDR